MLLLQSVLYYFPIISMIESVEVLGKLHVSLRRSLVFCDTQRYLLLELGEMVTPLCSRVVPIVL
jgi:hypothetical protein